MLGSLAKAIAAILPAFGDIFDVPVSFDLPSSERTILMETANRRLMWHGMSLFLLGLITGFLEQQQTKAQARTRSLTMWSCHSPVKGYLE